jgi:hypothetical protein
MDPVNARPDDSRLFALQTEPGDFETGRCADGRQVVFGLLCPHLALFYFDAQGNLLQAEFRDWEHPAPWRNGRYDIYDDAFEAAFAQQIDRWKAEAGFSPGTIQIKEFMDDAHWVGIQILPEHYQDLETSDEFDNEAERQEYIRDRDEWIARGDFVWWWAKDYYMNAEGEVEST